MEVDWSLVALIVVVGAWDAVVVAWVAGWQSKKRLTAWLNSDESDPYIRRITDDAKARIAESDARIRGALVRETTALRDEIEGRIEALRDSIDGGLGASELRLRERVSAVEEALRGGLERETHSIRERVDSAVASLSQTVESVRSDIGSRVPADLPGVVRGALTEELKAYELRQQAAYASEMNEYKANQRKELEELRRDPRVASNPSAMAALDRLGSAQLPKRFRKYQEMANGARQLIAAFTGHSPTAPSGNGGDPVMPAGTAPPPATGPARSPSYEEQLKLAAAKA